jgi:branched-chain amino acid transport system ATP-binding protein
VNNGKGGGQDDPLVHRYASHPLLEARDLTAGYGDLAAVRNVHLKLNEREIVAIFGPNGAGKTTTLRTLAGALLPLGGEVLWKGRPTRAPLFRRVRDGMGFVPEERSIITRLTVRDNLRLGRGAVSDAIDLFPQLGSLLSRPAGLLSGGEQQMLTLARCLASKPAVLLVDELSLGLAPVVVDHLLDTLRLAAVDSGVAVLLVEQQARRALRVADRWYLFRSGAVVAEGDAGSGIEAVEASYLASTGS